MPGNILWIDDEPEFIAAHAELLGDEGYKVRRIKDLDQAIHLLTTEKFDIVIMDLLMPPKREDRAKTITDLRSTGIKLHREVRVKLRLKIPIIFVSVVRDEKIRRHIAELEAQDNRVCFLVKPVPFADLILAVKQALGK